MHWNLVRLSLTVLAVCALMAGFLTAQTNKMKLSGRLTRAMGIGGESTGWALALREKADILGKSVRSVEIDSSNPATLRSFENQEVVVSGDLQVRQGVERGDRLVLVISQIKATLDLIGTEWLLEDLSGAGVMDRVQATLAFPEKGKVSGSASCNRFFGSATTDGDVLTFGPLGSTRKACPPSVMNQESKYMKALQTASHFEWKDPYLLVYFRGSKAPLRFSKVEPLASPRN